MHDLIALLLICGTIVYVVNRWHSVHVNRVRAFTKIMGSRTIRVLSPESSGGEIGKSGGNGADGYGEWERVDDVSRHVG